MTTRLLQNGELEARLRALGLGGRAALLVIDMQIDFVDPARPFHVPGTAEITPQVVRLLQLWRDNSLPIFHIVRFYLADASNAEPARRARLIEIGGVVTPGTEGAELLPSLSPPSGPPLDCNKLMQGRVQELGPQEWVIYKPRWGAFFQTPLLGLLRETEVEAVVICGCNLPNCPRATAFEASENDLSVALVADATSQTSTERLGDLALIGVTTFRTADLERA